MEKNKIAIPEFLSGGGEMGEMIRSFDWTATPLGEPEHWQQSLKTCVRILLTSPQPMFVWWGKNYINIYNDAYKFILGAKHPKALGRPGNETWKEIWKEVGARADIVFNKNEGTFDDALLLIMNRHGYDEETYFKFSYNPIPGDRGGTAGLFCACTEETDRIISERRMNALNELSKILAEKKSVAEVFKASIDVLKKNGKSFPYSLVYSRTQENQLGLVAYSSDRVLDFYPRSIDTDIPNDRYYDFLKVIATKKPVIVDDLRLRLGNLPTGEWSIPPYNALLLPIFHSNLDIPFAILKVGINPYLQPDEKYMAFAQLVVDQISTALSNAHALEDERKRFQVLEEIDRAKTVFAEKLEKEVAARTIDLQRINKELESFNYIASHDLQEPLRKIQTFVELIRRNEDKTQNSLYLERIQSSALRMSELIKSLLSYSNLSNSNELFESTDLNAILNDVLVDLELLIVEKKAKVTAEQLPLIKTIPMQMYQLFLNIISNSLKFSVKEPIINITTQRIDAPSANKILATKGNQQYIKISFVDNGIGIESKFNEQVFKLFQRLHLKNEFPGTGVGLSIVKRIVENHNGFIYLDSEPKKGTTINIYLPA